MDDEGKQINQEKISYSYACSCHVYYNLECKKVGYEEYDVYGIEGNKILSKECSSNLTYNCQEEKHFVTCINKAKVVINKMK